MAGPALVAKLALKRSLALALSRRNGDGGGPGPLGWLLLALIAIPLLASLPLLAIIGGQPDQGCGAQTTPTWDGPGSLGGVAGTGLTAPELRRLRQGGGASPLSPALAGNYTSTAYAPAAGGINVWNGGRVTAGGIRVDAGRRRAYLLAVDRRLIPLGTYVYIWPNPYGWRGPFVAADTGGAILERRIDVYVFGDRATALARAGSWGRRPVRIAAAPILSGGPPALALAGDTACADPGNGQLVGGNGKWVLTPYANRPGVGLTADMRRVLDKLSSFLPRRLVVCTGTNHNRLTTSGNVSDHWAGNAADLCSSQNGFPATGGGYGDRIAAAAFRVAGYDPARGNRAGRSGGANTVTAGGLRIQIIWKSYTGGNHYNHIHVGIARV